MKCKQENSTFYLVNINKYPGRDFI